MESNARRVWVVGLAALGGLALFVFHALITKLYTGAPFFLAPWLLLGLALVVMLRETARGVEPRSLTRLQGGFARLDGADLSFLVFFLGLLVVFTAGYMRATADGREYFIQVRSLLIDFDLDFANDTTVFRTGGTPEIFPFGSAVLWIPFFVAGHIWLGLLNLAGGAWSRDGFNNPYQMAIGVGTLVYGFIALVLIYRIVRDNFPKKVAVLATIVLSSASFLLWYLAIESSYSHGNSLFATTVFLFVWHRTRDARSARQWGLLGIAGGLMTMVRWQNVIFFVFPLSDVITEWWGIARRSLSHESSNREDARSAASAALVRQGLFALAAVVSFLPQMWFWKVVNGGWLAIPQRQTGQQWWSESLVVDVLFSSNHGLLAWHPVIYLAILGIPLFLVRDPKMGGLLVAVFAAQVYVNGAVAMWWGGHAFGGRRFASSALLFALGLAALIHFLQRRPVASVIVILLPFVAGNVFFILDIQAGKLPTGEGITADRIFGAAYDRLGNPFSFPANALFGRRYGMTPRQYDELGQQMFNNMHLDLGEPGDERYLGRGWSGPELGGGVSFRWAVGPESVVIAPLKAPLLIVPGEKQERAAYVFRFRAQPFRFEGAPRQSVEVWVNGELAGRQLLSEDLRDYEILIQRSLVRRNLNEIRMRYEWARTPADATGAADTRALAVRFDRIDLIRQ